MKRIVSIFALACLAAGLLGAQESREVRQTLSLDRDGRVTIDTYKGSITVETWDRAEVEVVAKIEADDWDSYADEKVRDTEIRITGSSSGVRIKTDYDRINRRSRTFWDWFGGETGNLPSVHYTVTMPASAHLQIKDYKSDSRLSGLRAGLAIDTYKGTIEVTGLEGGLDLETYKGEAVVEFRKLSNRFYAETYKGRLSFRIPRGSGFELDADLGRRADFQSEFDYRTPARTRKRDNQNYYGSVNGGGPSVKIKSYRGDIRLSAY